MKKYEVLIDIMRFKKGQVLSQEELELDNNNLDKWVSAGHIQINGDIHEKMVTKVNVLEETKEVKKVENDINNDGVFDKKDKSLAGKILGLGKGKKKK